jgi:hypothetical protein
MKRPRIVMLLRLLVFGQAAMFLTYFGLYAIYTADRLDFLVVEILRGERGPQGVVSLFLLIGTWLVLGLMSVVVGVALRRRRTWAWSAALILEGAMLGLALEAYFNRHANALMYSAMAVAAVVVFMLNQRETQTFYRAHDAPLESHPGS